MGLCLTIALLLYVAAVPPEDPAQLSAGELEAVVNTGLGTFRFEFAPTKAPKHVQQFIQLARDGYYDGSAFHWVKPNAAIQGGDPLLKDPNTPRSLWGSGGFNLVPTELNDIKHKRGIVSSLRIVSRMNTDGGQFFVCLSTQPGMDGKYSAFGRITEGLEVVDRISQVPTNDKGFTEKPVRITSVKIERRKPEPFVDATINQLRRTVTMVTTLGTIKIQMEPDRAPDHVRNFLGLTALGWYNGTEFHRVVKGFVAQGGFGETRSTGPDHPADRYVHKLRPEFSSIRHVRGSVSMARSGDLYSASTSFFLVLDNAPHLDNEYSMFGRVISGLEVLDAFGKEKLSGERPKRRLEIIEATVDPE